MEITKNHKGLWTAELPNGIKLEWATKKGLLEKIDELSEKDTYRVINYFDVWGNEKDGWEVNNLCEEGTIELVDYTSVTETIKKLKELGFLASHCRANMFDVWNDYDMIEYSRKNGKPLFRLERVQ